MTMTAQRQTVEKTFNGLLNNVPMGWPFVIDDSYLKTDWFVVLNDMTADEVKVEGERLFNVLTMMEGDDDKIHALSDLWCVGLFVATSEGRSHDDAMLTASRGVWRHCVRLRVRVVDKVVVEEVA